MKRRMRPVGFFLFVIFFVLLGFVDESMSAKPQVDGGYFHTLWLKSDGPLWAQGNNVYGQLGDGTTEMGRPILRSTIPLAAPGGSSPLRVSQPTT
jgi:alpha-tubulin suppressor-like RCC1 family protein